MNDSINEIDDHTLFKISRLYTQLSSMLNDLEIELNHLQTAGAIIGDVHRITGNTNSLIGPNVYIRIPKHAYIALEQQNSLKLLSGVQSVEDGFVIIESLESHFRPKTIDLLRSMLPERLWPSYSELFANDISEQTNTVDLLNQLPETYFILSSFLNYLRENSHSPNSFAFKDNALFQNIVVSIIAACYICYDKLSHNKE